MQESGIYLISKHLHFTSHDMLAYLKKIHNVKKLGHTGTLDKLATGCMCVLSGSYTRIQDLFLKLDKKYRFEATFGIQTDSLDADGSIIKKMDLPVLGAVEKAVDSIKNSKTQIPPVYSAIHVDGKRAHLRARDKQEVIMRERPIEVYELRIVDIAWPRVIFETWVSSGTYVRSMVRDIANLANSCAYVTMLERTAIGPFASDTHTDMKAPLISPQKDTAIINKLKAHTHNKENEYEVEFNGDKIRSVYFRGRDKKLAL